MQIQRQIQKNTLTWVGMLLLLFFSWLMLRITLRYIPVQTDVAFLQIKQTYIGNQTWFACFYIHVYTSMIALLAGFTQFWPRHTPAWTTLHRVMGYSYIIVVVGISGPASLVMGYYANGGWTARMAFLLLGICWIATTVIAWRKALSRDYAAHRRWMIRSYALTLSAITLRAWKMGIVYVLQPNPMDAYRVVAWLGWVGNWIMAEWWIARSGNIANRIYSTHA